MKRLGFSLIFYQFLSTNLFAEEFTHKFDHVPARKINIELLKGYHVNSECHKNKKECLALITVPSDVPSSGTKSNKSVHLRGNPASDFCESRSGKSEILRDVKNNEYDYCVLKDKYFVDSWDFYSQNKK